MEPLKHECGVAIVRLLKPLEYYQEKYGSWAYGLNKLYLLMEKQHNRGQEGAGVACVKLDVNPGEEFMFRERAEGSNAISEVFADINKKIAREVDKPNALHYIPYAGQMYMGHLRYSTSGKSGVSFVHPFMRRDNYRAKNFTLCGNFTLTNVPEVFNHIAESGQHPRQETDTFILLEQLGHRLDREVERLYEKHFAAGLRGLSLTRAIENEINLANVLRECAPMWDGGYVICGMTGSGETFVIRDPWGIRSAFYYADHENVILASERPVIQTAMDLQKEQVIELQPGQALFINAKGELHFEQIVEPRGFAPCSFERIYFSRGSDYDIYNERKKLGANLVPEILKAVDYDLKHTVFSFIPNTAEVACYGMVEGMNNYLNKEKSRIIAEKQHELTCEEIEEILSFSVRSEKVAIKDIKLRTFITQDATRNDMAAHVYDVTYGSIQQNVDNLVVIDDSIVRGTTLKQSIIKILARLKPKKIVIVSSAPQVRYPDFYGIDMSKMSEFIAFRSALALLEDEGNFQLINDVYAKCKAQQGLPKEQIVNYVKEIYAPFTDEQISKKMAELLTPAEVECPIEIIFQTIEGLHDSCPNNKGDWYFSGNYPTPGGMKLLNESFISFMESRK